MRPRMSHQLLEPLSRPRDPATTIIRERPGQLIAGFLAAGLMVALAIWGWPELRRTIHMHRM